MSLNNYDSKFLLRYMRTKFTEWPFEFLWEPEIVIKIILSALILACAPETSPEAFVCDGAYKNLL